MYIYNNNNNSDNNNYNSTNTYLNRLYIQTLVLYVYYISMLDNNVYVDNVHLYIYIYRYIYIYIHTWTKCI